MKALYIGLGKRFGRLVVISEAPRRRTGKHQILRRYFLVECDCGDKFEVSASSLTSKLTLSCGCYGREKRLAGLMNWKFKRRQFLDVEILVVKDLYQRYKSGALRRKLEWGISLEQFKTLTSSPCYYTNKNPESIHVYNQDSYLYNGIDRIDNTKGYVVDNCVPCCFAVNKAKGTLTEKDFLKLIKDVYEHTRRI
jgi:hypothetical protein